MQWLLIIPLLPYFFLLLYIYRGLRHIKPFSSEIVPDVRISVIIPCRNEEKTVGSLLEDIYSQDFNSSFLEIIVVDDNSTDRTIEIASGFKQIRGLKVLSSPGTGKKSALKYGAEIATGDLLITTDADCRAATKWVSTIASLYFINKPDLILGPVQLKSTAGFLGRFQELEFLSLQGITAGSAAAGNPVMANGANLAIPRDKYLQHADNLHIDIASGDDIFLLHSIKKEESAKIMWLSSAEAIVTSLQAPSFSSFLSQRVRWISKAGAYKDRGTQLVAIVTFVTILTLLFTLIAGFINPGFFLVLVILLVIKSVPDFLILLEISERYGRMELLRWFIPSQLFYPFYVIIVAFMSLTRKICWK